MAKMNIFCACYGGRGAVSILDFFLEEEGGGGGGREKEEPAFQFFGHNCI